MVCDNCGLCEHTVAAATVAQDPEEILALDLRVLGSGGLYTSFAVHQHLSFE